MIATSEASPAHRIVHPGESRGPTVPPREPVIVGTRCEPEKFERGGAWVPAFAALAGDMARREPQLCQHACA